MYSSSLRGLAATALVVLGSCGDFRDGLRGERQPRSSLQTPRRAHAVTGLADGRVLVTGGIVSEDKKFNQLTGTPSAEIYDPSRDAWSTTASMGTTHYGHSAARLGDGTVLVVDVLLDAAFDERYSPTTDTWTPVSRPPMRPCGVVALDDGSALLVGQNGQPTALRFDLAMGGWSVASAPPIARSFCHLLRLASGEVMVLGSETTDGSGSAATTRVDLYDPATNQWREGPPRRQASLDSAVVLRDGRVLAVSERDAELWTPGASGWVQAPALLGQSPSVTFSGLVAVGDGVLALLHSGPSTPLLQLLETGRGEWVYLNDADRGNPGVPALLADGRVLVVGGTSFLESRVEVITP